MGMKVAAVSLMCQDVRVFQAMEMAGTPCPYEGTIGKEASVKWEENAHERPDAKAHTKKMRERAEVREASIAHFLEENLGLGKLKKKQWISQCKKTKFTEGKYKGVNKSGQTCKILWNNLLEA